LILLIVAFGSVADGKWFRVYSYITLVVIVAAGALAFMYLPRIAAHLPTPWMGVQERINIYGYLLWIAMLAAVLLHNGRTTVQRTGLPPVIPTTSG
jgi:hypothetical protein